LTRRHLTYAALALLLAVLLVGSTAALGPAAPAPPEFSDTLVTEVPSPTALAFTPDGRMLITSQSGQLWVYQGGTLLATPALDLAAADRLCSGFERGLLGVALDPAFATNRSLYLYYTFKKLSEKGIVSPTSRGGKGILEGRPPQTPPFQTAAPGAARNPWWKGDSWGRPLKLPLFRQPLKARPGAGTRAASPRR
jgi:hypothetical protein